MLVFFVVVSTTACTTDPQSSPADATAAAADGAQETAVPPEPPTFSVKDGAEDVDPSAPVTVVSDVGLESVEMTNENGKVVEDKLSADGKKWSTAEVLGYNRTYTIEATDTEGQTETITFSTPTPSYTTGVALGPLEGSTVGVGQAITFRFPSAPKDREAVEEAIEVKTSNDTEGGFYWIDPHELRWRPAEFWEPGTKVTVNADIYGLNMGEGLYGAEDNATSFTIGKDVRGVVDDATKTMTVYENGAVVREIPISLGRDGTRWATPNGIYVVGDEHESLVMDSSTFGYAVEDGGYVTPVSHATQMSYSGIYIHGAPWAVGALGSYNQSHGCINMTIDDAAWIQQMLKRGDPITVQNTTAGTLPGTDGLGYWNIDWETWKKGNTDTGSAY
ncbi:L,D-transpeptidase [Corynebacterium cystitidis]|uniref:Lipoprotein-anchoring transpeptidase ErfK/SrfK n=1 Tax=Corynebacterium cystitidis DSM 20524 TaxID=1121357 RepID=A0A1H9SK94_9CORY|nr:Putative L,D-transpeptidase LppS precursor [Corynebacterium cystitidis DSM 20524]SER85318.1 Lipoprotein-anchoring transpeptidase ErfK/SrfK [Corynebacterium cystitidis DSM 20524]SNV65919.1 ErfK/YbiS/YcfS/YnhG family lipoprotein [Corynebacterium cystitidis]